MTIGRARMRKRVSFFAITAAVLAGLVVWGYLIYEDRAAPLFSNDKAATSTDEQQDQSGEAGHPKFAEVENTSGSGVVVAPERSNPFRGIPRSRKGLPLADDPFFAESVLDQEWLDRNGYPNRAEWEALAAASLPILQMAADMGDKEAAAMASARRLALGDREAIDEMIRSGAEGSIFSLELLAATLARDPQDRELAYAVSRVAEMRGNRRLGPGRDALFAQPLSPVERLRAEATALRLYTTLNQINERLRGGLPPTPPDPRPVGP